MRISLTKRAEKTYRSIKESITKEWPKPLNRKQSAS